MIRIICQETNTGDAAIVGGPVHLSYKTFDVAAPELEAWLNQPEAERSIYIMREPHGVELISVDTSGIPVTVSKGGN